MHDRELSMETTLSLCEEIGGFGGADVLDHSSHAWRRSEPQAFLDHELQKSRPIQPVVFGKRDSSAEPLPQLGAGGASTRAVFEMKLEAHP